MGPGIAQMFSMGGYQVTDVDSAGRDAGKGEGDFV